MEAFQVQPFNYDNNPPNPPADDLVGDVGEANNENNTLQKSDGGNYTTTTICIWGTQPPLDPALLDIQKIAVLTRKFFGSDDLTICIPKVCKAPPQSIPSIFSFYASIPISHRFV
jgi:hypothetical protein